MFCRSGLPYAKGTSTRLIRLISIGGGECCSSGAFYLFCFNRLAFLCCSEAGCGPIVGACLKEKEAGFLYRDCNIFYIVLLGWLFLFFLCVLFVFFFSNKLFFNFFFFFFFFFCFLFYLFCFNRLVFLCCSEAGCGPIVCSCLTEKEAGSLYRDCNSYYIVLICCFLLIF